MRLFVNKNATIVLTVIKFYNNYHIIKSCENLTPDAKIYLLYLTNYTVLPDMFKGSGWQSKCSINNSYHYCLDLSESL